MEFKTSKESYDNAEGARNYLAFLASDDGRIQQELLLDAFRRRLSSNTAQHILDVGCGSGWLTNELSQTYANIQGCDGSSFLLEHARQEYKHLNFTLVDLNATLPFSDNEFDTLIVNMVAHDIENQPHTFAELHRILTPGGTIMFTFANPYYGFPLGTWKRGWLGKLLFRKPQLHVRPYHWFAKQDRHYTFNDNIQCNFYKMSEHVNNLIAAGFTLAHMLELESKHDSETFNLRYTMHRFPLIVYVEAQKPA